MSQGSVTLPTAGIVSGVTFAQDANTALDAFRTMFSGSAAPSADAPEEGQLWLDTGTSTNYKLLRVYDGSTWPTRAYLDDVNHIHFGPLGGGLSTVASASTSALGVSTGSAPSVTPAISISGVTGIVSFGSSAVVGQVFAVTFQGVLTLTYNATSFILPGKANITTAAGDMSLWQYLGSGNWQCLVYQPLATLVGSVGTVTGAFITNNVISPTQITANQNDYAPTGAANATIWELTSDGLSDYLITGISASQTSGRQIIVRNANASGGGRFYFPNQSTSSAAANRFKMPGVVQLNPGQQVQFIYDNSATAWVPQNVVVAQPMQSAFKNLYAGNVAAPFGNFTAPAAPTSQFKITADRLQLADTDGNTVNLASVSVTADLATSGANGLDSTAGAGRAAATIYSAWVIYNALTNTSAGLLSTSITSPTLPSGYTFKARVAWGPTYSSANNFIPMLQVGRIVKLQVPGSTLGGPYFPQIAAPNNNVSPSAAGLSTWATAFALPYAVPPTASRMNVQLAAQGGAGASLLAAPSTAGYLNPQSTATGSTLVEGHAQYASVVSGGGNSAGSLDIWWLIESTNVGAFGSLLSTDQCILSLKGWEDNL